MNSPLHLILSPGRGDPFYCAANINENLVTIVLMLTPSTIQLLAELYPGQNKFTELLTLIRKHEGSKQCSYNKEQAENDNLFTFWLDTEEIWEDVKRLILDWVDDTFPAVPSLVRLVHQKMQSDPAFAVKSLLMASPLRADVIMQVLKSTGYIRRR
jgi:hypothetical protein